MLKNKKSLQEQIDRIKYVTKYTINETPKYKSLVGNSGIDRLPEYLMKEAGKPEDAAPAADPNAAPAPAPDANAAPAATPPPVDGATPEPAPQLSPTTPPVAAAGAPAPEMTAPAAPATPPDTNVDITTAQAPSTQPDPSMDDSAPVDQPVDSPEKRAMQLQLDALQKMSYKIEDLGSTIDGLNQRMAMYSAEVDKVREPSDMEKFENRKNDSSPYYFNLNDLWKDDNFKARMDQYSKGYVKTEDGYVADFDDLPKLAPHEVKASFDDI